LQINLKISKKARRNAEANIEYRNKRNTRGERFTEKIVGKGASHKSVKN
jgi:hypothetical protein